ncbi:MAG: Lrp/AsnC family transcriptional regulator [Candidatus Aenigmarchaeota archaeon]|nr:Lrp/AsnC family transcriptional regulator [Candidatus Aenigmarchaeota archaeon]
MSIKSSEFKTKVNTPLKTFKTNNVHSSIDEIDKKILRFLIWDARLSYREIARQSKLSTTTVIEHLKKLKSSGIIKGYSVNLDSKKLGYELSAIIELVAPKLSLLKTMEKITESPNVYAIYHTTGDVDAIIIAKFKGIDELQKFLSGLYDNLDIQRSETRIVLNTVKEDFRVMIQ